MTERCFHAPSGSAASQPTSARYWASYAGQSSAIAGRRAIHARPSAEQRGQRLFIRVPQLVDRHLEEVVDAQCIAPAPAQAADGHVVVGGEGQQPVEGRVGACEQCSAVLSENSATNGSAAKVTVTPMP